MKNLFRYRLSTLFLIMTVVAVTIGIKLALLELVESTSSIQKLFNRLLSLYTWVDVPFYVVCSLGIKWILVSENAKRATKQLAITALTAIVVWQLLISPLVITLVAAADVEAITQIKLAGWMGLLSHLLGTVCWLMMILAILMQAQSEEAVNLDE